MMNRKDFAQILNEKILILDGGYGTEFIKRGYKNIPAEILNIRYPEVVYNLQSEYVKLGADILLTNTFSGNRKKLKELNFEKEFEKVNVKAVEIAKQASKGKALVFGDLSSLGEYPKPMGALEMDEAIDEYYQQAKMLFESGVDGFIVETMTDIKELKAAVYGIRKVTEDLPLIAHMTFEENGRSVTGTSVEIFANVFNDLDVDVLGINCTLGPEELLKVFERLSLSTNKFLSVEPNAGKPVFDGKNLEYKMTPEIFGMFVEDYLDLGVNIIGGCCGTSPEHIKVIRNMVKRRPKKIIKEIPIMYSSRTILNKFYPFTVIGERINPAGNKKFQNEIEEFNFENVIKRANSQKNAKAHAIDVNLGIEKILNEEHFKQIIIELDKHSSLPISFDIQNIGFLETALKEYPGRPIINSSKLSKKDLDRKLKLIKKYGGLLIVLALEKEILESAEERLQLVLRKWPYIESKGITKDRIIVDPLVLSLAANNDPNITLETVKLLSKNGFNTTMGLSNLSFGLPNRNYINAAFLSRAKGNGLTSAILNPEDEFLMNTLNGNLLLDKNIVIPSKVEKQDELTEKILQGEEGGVKRIIENQLKEKSPLEVSQDVLGKAMEKIGDLYAQGNIYLPELLLAAETVKPIFDYLNNLIPESQNDKKAKVVLATVEGDIHDIGKNIVAAVLRSANFKIIDLGKDVETSIIIDVVQKEKPNILGLSAMMTTTVGKIEEVVNELKKLSINLKVIAGGASMNRKLAETFGCDAYAKDASEGLKICKSWVNLNS